MFQYTNTIVLNSLKDATTGLDKIISDSTSGKEFVEIRRVNKFLKSGVCAIYKRLATDPVIGKADFTIPASPVAGIYRLKLYIRLSGSQNSYYSNDFVFKGKPFVYEFKVKTGDTAAEVAKEIKRVIDKIQAFYGDKYIKVSVNGAVVSINCTDEYQVITEAKIQKLDSAANNPLTNEVFEDLIAGSVIKSVEGFGTYTHILKDLRLPTIESRRFEAVNQEELPIPGAKYNQYIIEYKVDRGLFGGAAIGQQVTSKTTHVFYVLSTIASDFETDLGILGTVTAIAKPIIVTDATIVDIALVKAGTEQTISPAITEGTLTKVDAVADASWVKLDISGVTVKVSADSNNGTKARSSKVTVTVTDETGASAAKTITVTQANA